MKKTISLVLCLLMVFGVACIGGISASAEGNTYTVGATADGANYTSLADAVNAVSDGDTIQFVEDVTATNVTLNKSITIDTNGFVWYGGTSSKANCATIDGNATVSIINSKRTALVTADTADFDILCKSVKNQGVFILKEGSRLNMKNIAAKSTNTDTNNQGCVVFFYSSTYSTTATTAVLSTENCYLTSSAWGAVGGNSNTAMQINAVNSVFGGSVCSIFYVGNASSTVDSVMSYENCTFLKPISACNANNATAVDNATSTFEKVTYNFKDCTATSLFAPSATAVFDGSCVFNTVKSGVVVDAASGVSLYANEKNSVNVSAGEALTADSPIYSVVAATTYQIYIDAQKVDEIDVGAQYTLPAGTADGFVCYTDGTEYFAEKTTITPSKNLNLSSVTVGAFNMQKGASIRLTDKKGIRFYSNVDTAKIADLLSKGAEMSMGTLIAPEDLLDGELTLATAETNRVNIPYVTGIEDNQWYTETIGETEFAGMVGSLVTIQDKNIARNFVGRGYITVTIGGITKTVYADYAKGDGDVSSVANNTRSLAFVADALTKDTDKFNLLDSDTQTLVNGWAAKLG